MLLSIDTSTRYAGVALSDEERVVSCRLWYSRINHTAELMPAVAQSLESQNVSANELEGVAVALGPGGFSSLRVGLSVAKGLVAASSLPLVGVGTLNLEARPYLETGMAVCAMLDAGRGEVATAKFDSHGLAAGEETIWPPDELLDSITEPTQFCGEGVIPWVSLIKERLGPKALVMASPSPGARLWSLATIARERLAAGITDEPASLEPNYLRMPSIGQPKRRDRRRQVS
jgi:tRNA threonylcarbamoyladenosine biosynthesis protein TsaB